MKRAEKLAWMALAGLVAILAILLTGGFLYRVTGFWAGAMLAGGQAVVVALAAWGLMIARQVQELHVEPAQNTTAAPAPTQGFRMSMGDDAAASPAPSRLLGGSDIHGGREPGTGTLDTGYQRLWVAISAIILLGLGIFAAVIVYGVYHWAGLNPDQTVPVAGTYAEPRSLDELGVVIGLAAAVIYCVLWWLTRVRRDTEGYGEAVRSGFTLGISGMAALGVASVLGYLKVSYASEVAAGVIAALMILQGLELFVNSLRSYSGVEELDQDAVDLQALPFVPMLGSLWLGGLKMLFAQSVGLSTGARSERGVIARMMPRAFLAMVIIAIGCSCLRVVAPGEVAVLERFGYAPRDPVTKELLPAAILGPGLHLTLPWPIDDLVRIPTEQLQLTDVGSELHAPKDWGKKIDFQFWTFRAAKTEADAEEDEFLTGDPGRQLLETYVQVRWRVANPGLFYTALSHSDYFERAGETTKALPIYQAIIKQCTSYAVTQTFATHSLEHIMISNRGETENHCKKTLQDKLNALHSGIEVVNLTIKDLHPPYWRADRQNPTAPEIWGSTIERGPASAFEFVVTSRAIKERVIQQAEAQRLATIARATGDADAEKAQAEAYMLDRIAAAQGEAGRLGAILQYMDPKDRAFQTGLLEQQMMYKSMADVFGPVTKIIVDPDVNDLQIFQTTDNGMLLRQPPMPTQ